ncbi:MAG: molecular chaperone DnaK [Planctomycetota bacterium]|jgi:molecular chaperone DnaK
MGYIELNVLNNDLSPQVMGIDLGTTNSLAATWIDGHPVVIKPEHSAGGSVPSVIHIAEDGTAIVGQKALDQATVDPRHTIFSIKRMMGRGLSDITEELAAFPFPISEDEKGLLKIDAHGRQYTPQELSSLILTRVHDLASQSMGGQAIQRAVITVPAYFDDTQRQATRDAARLAGIDVMRIINEPTAASLAYGLDQTSAGNIAVYDLGGGTFDISILSIEEGVFQVLSTNGDTHLGGDDFDRILAKLVLDKVAVEISAEELADPALQQAARLAAEKCKVMLSKHPEAELHLVLPDSGVNVRRNVTREEFNELVQPLIERTLDCCRQALADAELEIGGVAEVVLVGGSTRMPLVRDAVETFFGRLPHTELNPDEVVALGAAIQAHILAGGSRDLLLMDVTPLSLGLETMGGAISKIIMRNSTIPCSATEGFTTYADNQTGIDFHILQGERELAEDCRSLGRFKLSGIPPMPAGMARVAVRFHVDADGLLVVTAREDSTGAKSSIEVKPKHGLTDEEVETMLSDSLTYAREDFEAGRNAGLVTEIGTMIHATEKTLPNAEGGLDLETIEDIRDAITAAKAATAQTSLDGKALQAARDLLEQATMPLASFLMDNVAKTALSGKSLKDV